MAKYKHFLITRFNVLFRTTPTKNWAESVEGKSLRVHTNDLWLKKRMELFELYCLPSVKGQTNQNFEWLILMSENTSPYYMNQIRSVLPDNSYIVSGDGRMLDYTLASKGMSLLSGNSDFVISSSLDSDDAISKNYIDIVQKHVRPERMYVNLVKGVTVAHHRGFQYIGERAGRGVNHFRSLVEPSDHINSVYMVSHGESDKDAPVVDVESEEYGDWHWLEVIHGDNCSNRFRKKKHDKTRPLEEIADLFSIDKSKVKNKYPLDHQGYVIDESWGRSL